MTQEKTAYTGKERRRHSRILGRFIVSYRILEEADNIDITQSRNLGLGGMLLTTNRKFSSGTKLALEIRLPFDPHPIITVARVVESREVTKDLIYDTRLEFLDINVKHRRIIEQTVEFYLRKGSDK